MTNNEEIISRFKLQLKEQTETAQRIAKLIEESKDQIETAQRFAKLFEGAAEEFARFSKQADEISKLVQKQTEQLLSLANEILTSTPSLQKAEEPQSSLMETPVATPAPMENNQNKQVDQIEKGVKSPADVPPEKEKQIDSVTLTDSPQIENDQVDQIEKKVKAPAPADVPPKKEKQIDSGKLTEPSQIENDPKQVDQNEEVKSSVVPPKNNADDNEGQLGSVELTGASQIGNDQQQQQVDQNEKSPDSPPRDEEFGSLHDETEIPKIPLEGVEEYEEDKEEEGPIMHMNSSGTPTPRADEISIDSLPPPPSPLGTEDGEQQALDSQSLETVDRVRVPSPEVPILTSPPKALIVNTTSPPLSMKSSPNAAGTQPQKCISVGHDQQAEWNLIKMCFSLKENSNNFESPPKEINGYRWSLSVQCVKEANKLLLGTFLKCHGPVHELDIPDAGIVRVREPLFRVHTWKSDMDHLPLGKRKESVKFEPPYTSPKGVWFEMKGKQELINEGFITEDELKIQVSVMLQFHSAGSLTSGASN